MNTIGLVRKHAPCINSYIKAVTYSVPGHLKPLAPEVVLSADPTIVPSPPQKLTSHSLAEIIPKGNVSAISGIGAPFQIRLAHTDVKFPDMTDHLRSGSQDPKKSTRPLEYSRKATHNAVGAVSLVGAVVGAKAVARSLLESMGPAGDVLAMSKIEIDLKKIPEGKNVTFKWGGKPLFVKHRTAKDIEREGAVDLAELRDPQADSDRVKRPEWLVLIGICTHLGCVPIADAGNYNGYYCPCHGSHYDGSGRIRKGPAPENLEVPNHEFVDDNLLIVG